MATSKCRERGAGRGTFSLLIINGLWILIFSPIVESVGPECIGKISQVLVRAEYFTK